MKTETKIREPELRGFPAHDKEDTVRWLRKDQMVTELGAKPEELEEMWGSGSTVDTCAHCMECEFEEPILYAKVREIIPYLVHIDDAKKDLVVVVDNATIDSVQLAKLEELGLVIESINTHTEETWFHGALDPDFIIGFGIVFGKVDDRWDTSPLCCLCGDTPHVCCFDCSETDCDTNERCPTGRCSNTTNEGCEWYGDPSTVIPEVN